MHRRSLRGMRIARAGRRERKHIGDVERARQQIRVAREVRLEQVDAAAMERHHRRVRRFEAVLDVHLQNAMFGGRIPAVGPEEMFHDIRVDAIGSDNACAKQEEDRGAFDAQRVRRTGERQLLERRPSRQLVNHADRIGVALEGGASGRVLEIFRAVFMQNTYQPVATQVRRVRHRRTPVAVGANQNVLVDERGILRDQHAHALEIVPPDRIRELHRVDEPRPARRAVGSRESELRVGQLCGPGVDRIAVVLPQVRDRDRVAGMDAAQKLLGLTMKLLEVGADGQATD